MTTLRASRVLMFLFLCLFTLPLAAGSSTQTYDEVGRLVGVDYENGASIRFVYDAAGNMLERVITLAEDPVDGETEPEPEVDIAEEPPTDVETVETSPDADADTDVDADVVSSDLVVHVDTDPGAETGAELPSNPEAEEDDSPKKDSGCVYGASAPQVGPGVLLLSMLLILASWRRFDGFRREEG